MDLLGELGFVIEDYLVCTHFLWQPGLVLARGRPEHMRSGELRHLDRYKSHSTRGSVASKNAATNSPSGRPAVIA